MLTTIPRNTTAICAADVSEAFQLITQGLETISTNEHWRQFLIFQSRFHDYSFYNRLLIFLQNPHATYVAGYKAWQRLGRQVRKGTRGIRILAPLVRKSRDNPFDHRAVNIDLPLADIPTKETETRELYGFRLVSVFDLSQTEGDQNTLPVVITGLRSEHPDSRSLYGALVPILKELGIAVREDPRLPAKGAYHINTQSISIQAGAGPDQKLKTLLHELAHHFHHTTCYEEESRSDRELLAESSAFLVCHHLGIDTSDYSFPYLRQWMDDPSQLNLLGEKILRVSRSILAVVPGW